MKKTVIIITISALVLIGVLTSKIINTFNKITVTNKSNTTSGKNVFETSNPFNILLLGYAGGKHDGSYLTDSMMVIHVNPREKKTLLISLPRDLWVKIPTDKDGSYWKVNAAYAIGLDDVSYSKKPAEFKGEAGGGSLVKKVVANITGLRIDRFVAVDFEGFKKTIDALGGVDIAIDKTFEDPEYPVDGKETDLCGRDEDFKKVEKFINNPTPTPEEMVQLIKEDPKLEEYIKNIKNNPKVAFPCRYETLRFEKGSLHMDGSTALKYVRSRHSLQDGTDFSRSKRQQNLLVAVKQKVLSIDFIPRAIPFFDSLQNDFKTDLSLNDMRLILSQANDFSKYNIKSIALTDDNYLKDSFSDDGQYVLMPKEGNDKWRTIQNWISSNTDSSTYLRYPIIQIENATATATIAELAAKKLKNKGFITLESTSAAILNNGKTTIMIFNNKVDKTVINALTEEFGVQPIQAKDTNQEQYDILVMIGQDYISLNKNK